MDRNGRESAAPVGASAPAGANADISNKAGAKPAETLTMDVDEGRVRTTAAEAIAAEQTSKARASTAKTSSAKSATEKTSDTSSQSEIGASFEAARADVSDLIDTIFYYISLQADRVRQFIRRTIILVAMGIIALLAAGAVVVTAVVYCISGIALGLSRLTHYAWLGNLLTGVIILALIGIAAMAVLGRIKHFGLKQIKLKYQERLKEEQRRANEKRAERKGMRPIRWRDAKRWKNMSDTHSSESSKSEADLIAAESKRARARMTALVTSLRGHAAGTVDPRMWAKSYPKSTMAGAAAAGFAASAAAIPSRRQQARESVRIAERLANAAERQARAGVSAPAESAAEDEDAAAEAKEGLFAGLGIMLLKQLLPLLQPLIGKCVAHFTSRAHAHADQNDSPSASN